MYYIGVDLGTSAVKLLLMDGAGKILNVVSRAYPLHFPQPGWSEQDPEETADIDRTQVAGIGCGGQMHGLVALDAEDRVIRPAILWNDGRTEEETAWLNTEIGKKKLSELTANIAFAGFTAPKLLWMKKNEPENFARIRKIMLPKDYVNYCLTGVHSCDYSDASGMLLLDVQHKCWSKEMLEICGVEESWMPQLFESYDCVGTLMPAVASKLGLPETVAGSRVETGPAGDGQSGRRSRRQCRCGRRDRCRRRRRLQHQPRDLGDDLHLIGEVRRRSEQCPALLRPCRRRLSSDGLHALRGQLQQVVL